jgi:hypothetical protein
MMSSKEKEHYLLKVVVNMRVNFIMINIMDTELFIIKMVINMWEFG